MREVCIVNNGENINKIIYSLGINCNKESSNEKIFGYRYVVLKEGCDDITIIKNYNPYNVKRAKKEETMLDIYAQGFEVVGGEAFEEGDMIVIKKPNGVRYSVKPLETLSDIARKFGVDEFEIMQNNNLTTNKLFVGQILLI